MTEKICDNMDLMSRWKLLYHEALEKYIKYYNEQRIKEKLGWMSPVEYRLNFLVA